MTELTIFTDGASRGNPGPASTGFVIKNSHETIFSGGSFLGVATNNTAEYSAIIEAFEKVVMLDSNCNQTTLNFKLDSKLAVEQLSGRYKIKNTNLRDFFIKIKQLENMFARVTYQHIPRELNHEADTQANLVLDNQTP